MIGVDPNTNADRFTGGIEYLGAGVQLLPLVAGLFAIPELLDGLKNRNNTADVSVSNGRQTKDGFIAVWQNKWLALRGGAIGAFIGILPGLGGAMADWMAYGQAVATTKNPKVKFGKGNIRGVIGPEGANNAEKFFDSMLYGFMLATVLVGALCLITTPIIARIAQIPYKYYFPLLLGFIILACVQYTGGWEDYAILAVCSVLGVFAKKYKFSRPALLFGFILSDRIEQLTLQMTSMYSLDRLVDRPIFLGLIVLICIVLFWGLTQRNKLEYA